MLRAAVALVLVVPAAAVDAAAVPTAACASLEEDACETSSFLQHRSLVERQQVSSSAEAATGARRSQRLRVTKLPVQVGDIPVGSYFGGGMLVVNITLNMDKKEIPVNIDLGSGPLWVLTDQAKCCELFTSNQSCSACADVDKPGTAASGAALGRFVSTYGAGNATGSLSTERVHIGEFMPFQINVGMTDLMFFPSGIFRSPAQGMMGLGLPYLNEGLTDAIVNPLSMSTIEMMRLQKVIEAPLFTLVLNHFRPSFLTLGAVDLEEADGEMVWSPAVRPMSPRNEVFGFWSVAVDAVTVEGSPDVHQMVGFLDSGYSAIGLAKELYDYYLERVMRIPNAHLALVPIGPSLKLPFVLCSAVPELPMIHLSIAGQALTIEGKDIANGNRDDIMNLAENIQIPPALQKEPCVLNLIDLVPPGYGIALGTPFLHRYVTAFDQTLDMPRIGIAKKKPEPGREEERA